MHHNSLDSLEPLQGNVELDKSVVQTSALMNISVQRVARYSAAAREYLVMMSENPEPCICHVEDTFHAVMGIDFTLHPAFDPAHPVLK